jgi:hypothetical protein
MSIEGTAWAWRLKGVSPLAKLVALRIGDVYPPMGEFARCSLDGLLEFTDASESLIRDAVAELVNKTEILFDERSHGEFWFWLPIEDRSVSKREKKEDQRRAHIYVISRPTFTKIGITTKNPARRMADLQAQSPEQKLTLAWSAWGPLHLIRKVEMEAHRVLAEHRVLSEWFAVTPERAIDVVRAVMVQTGMKVSV